MMDRALGSGRGYVLGYLAALSLIGLVALFLHGVVNGLVHEERRASLNLTRAAQLESQAQRIHTLLGEASAPSGATDRGQLAAEIQTAATRMARIHLALLHALDDSGEALPISSVVDTLYFGGPHYLDERIRRFVGASRDAAGALEGGMPVTPFLRLIMPEARMDLGDSMEVLVTQLEEESTVRIAGLRRTQMAAAGVLILTLLAEALFIFRPMIRTLLLQRRALYDMARTDPLTGSHNRRSFLSLGERDLARCRQNGTPLTVLALDIDHFKAVNDTWGHSAGDAVIRSLARLGLDTLPPGAHFGRLGGEEFAAILPGSPLNVGEDLAESLRRQVSGTPVVHEDTAITCTVSIGVAALDPVDGDLLDLLARADAALYEAKDRGRNRVIVDYQPASRQETKPA
jgi:diguanylate cyclase (GGDEF)-like protein